MEEGLEPSGGSHSNSDADSEVGALGLRAYLCFPLLTKERLLGTLLFGTRKRDAFVPDEVSLMRMVSMHVATALELAHQAQNDSLTGLPNRRAFNRVLVREIALAKRHDHALGLLMFDLDHFKRVNDTFGHEVGDRVLHDLAGVVRAVTRDTDVLARWGGEEFSLVTPQTDETQLRELGERVRSAVEGHDFGKIGPLTVSLGGANFRSDDTDKTLFSRADSALYRAKEKGRNRLEI